MSINHNRTGDDMRTQARYKKGDKIGGQYQVHQVLMGGMGEVYLCLDIESGEPYALKTFQRKHITKLYNLKKVFENEVATWVSLGKHPNIVRCFDMRSFDSQPFMRLEWVFHQSNQNSDLRTLLQQKPMELKQVLEIAIDICLGLEYAQKLQPGLVHRDIKPENILVANGWIAKVTDFGIAQIIQSSKLELVTNVIENSNHHSLLVKNGIVGTPAYMSPEQWKGDLIDVRSDIYSTGCLLYELLTGSLPFSVNSSFLSGMTMEQWLSTMKNHHEQSPVPNLPQTYPTAVNNLIHRCLAKDRNFRPQNFAALAEELKILYREMIGEPLPKRSEPSVFSPEDYNMRGNTYIDLGMYKEALNDFNEALEQDSKSGHIYNNRGLLYRRMREYKSALADYNRALELDLDDFATYTNRGVVHYSLSQYGAALADYNRAIELNPNIAAVYANRGVVYSALRQYTKAIEDYNRAIELDSNPAQYYYLRGNIHSELQDYAAALADYNRAIEINPDLTEAYTNRGAIFAELDNHEAALADYRKAIELNPDQAETYINLGALIGNQGNHREALSFFEKAAELGHPQGIQYLAQTKKFLGQTEISSTDLITRAAEACLTAETKASLAEVVAQYPFMKEDRIIKKLEQVINNEIPPEYRPAFQQRLNWLQQIASDDERPGFWGRLFNRK